MRVSTVVILVFTVKFSSIRICFSFTMILLVFSKYCDDTLKVLKHFGNTKRKISTVSGLQIYVQIYKNLFYERRYKANDKK